MSDENKDPDFQKINKSIRSILISKNEELGNKMGKNVENWMKFRREIFLAAMTVLIAVTPFTDKFVHCYLTFSIGYVGLFVSAITGLITEEIRLKTLHVIWEYGSKQMKKSIDALFGEKNSQSLVSSLEELNKAEVPSSLDSLLGYNEVFSAISFWLFIASLILIFISVMPFAAK